AAEAHHCVRDLSADFVDHDAFDLTYAVAVRAIDRRPFDFVAADEARGLAPLERAPLRGICCRHEVLPVILRRTHALGRQRLRGATVPSLSAELGSISPQLCLSDCQWVAGAEEGVDDATCTRAGFSNDRWRDHRDFARECRTCTGSRDAQPRAAATPGQSRGSGHTGEGIIWP